MELLIKSMTELRQVVSLNGDLEYQQLSPHLRAAQLFVSRYTGRLLLTQLADEALTDDQRELLTYVQVPMANLALLKLVSSGIVVVSDIGIMRSKTASTADAFEWQIERASSQYRQEAFNGIEALLTFLEEKLTTFPAYANGQQYDLIKKQLIKSADVFSRYYEIGGSRLVFETLTPSMLTSEVRLLAPALGSALPGLLATELTDVQKAQLDAARRALVYATIARALRERLVSLTDAGVQINGISQFATLRYQQPPDEKQLNAALAHFDSEASTYLSELVSLLHPTADASPGANPVLGSRIVSF